MSDRRVIVGLGGRLGNQMFQYAAGKALAMRLGATLSFEGYGKDSGKKSRVQVLDSFALPEDFAPVRSRRFDKLLIKLARMGWPVRLRGLPIYVEPHFHYDPCFETLDRGCYLVGGWMSERYFGSIRSVLLEDFSFKGKMSDGARQMAAEISASQSPVALHVRRGDYVEDPRILARHGICGREYYEAAMNLLRSQCGQSRFFVFSDDVERVQDEFSGLPGLTYVRGNSQEEDLYLMAACRHIIIANSTFSWWAAWLNRHADKLVIAPRQWFGPELMRKFDTSDLLPTDWRLI
jgi:hypothetical protein